MEHKIELTYGYTDKDGVTHKDVTFSKRLTAGDIILLDNNPMANSQTQREQLIRRMMITKFGTLRLPVSLTVLASLDTMDDDAMRIGADRFLQLSRDERQAEYRDGDEVKLIFGIEIDGVNYDVVKFGRRLTVADNIEADRQGFTQGIARLCYQICRQIVELRNEETGIKLDAPISSETLSTIDSEDLNVLLFASEFFRLAPSRRGNVVPSDAGPNGAADSPGNRVDGGGDTAAADGTAQ